MRLAPLVCVALATLIHGQEPAVPVRDTGPDVTGSLPAAVYERLPALVRNPDASAPELRSLCDTHGAEAALNALYLARRVGNAARIEGILGDRLPEEAALIRAFDAAGRPDPRDLEFVQLPDAWGRPSSSRAWLVRSSRDGVEVLKEDLSLVRCAPGAVTRPRAADPFREHCRAFFSTQLVAAQWGIKAWQAWDEALNTDPFQSCVLADWSFRRGDIGNTLKLLAHARAILAHEFHRGNPEGEPLVPFIWEELATALERQAVLAAGKGESRTELRERWRTIVRVRAEQAVVRHEPLSVPAADYFGSPMPFSGFGWHKARDMVGLYDKLLAEDEAWREPAPEQLAAQDATARARYWMHKLRDSRAGRHHRGSHSPSELWWGSKDDPARKLFALGASAIPVLIEHYEDPAPTCGYRSFYSRSTGTTSYTPCRHGDVCAEILYLISGQVFRNRAAAAAWWEKVRWTDPPAHYLQQLRSRDRETREKAALWLITLGDRAHIDAVMARILDGDPAWRAMLAFVKGRIEDAHADRLAPLLEHEDHAIAIHVAWALQDTSRARDAREAFLRRALAEASQGTDPGTGSTFTPYDRARSGLWFLAATQDEHLRAAFARTLSAAGRETPDVVLELAHLFPSREVLDVLLRLLREDGRAVVPIRRMLIDMWGVSDMDEGWSEEEVRRWLLENRIDWAARQREVHARMAWDTQFYPRWFR